MKKHLFLAVTISWLSTFSTFSQMSTDLYAGIYYPGAVTYQAKEFLAEAYGLHPKSSIGYMFGGRVRTSGGWSFSVSSMEARQLYSSDTLDVQFGQVFALGGAGKELQLTDRIIGGVAVHIGVVRSEQQAVLKNLDSDNLWNNVDAGNYSHLFSSTKTHFASMAEIYVDFLLKKRLILTVGCRNSVLPFNNLDTVGNSVALYGNYLAPYLKLTVKFPWASPENE